MRDWILPTRTIVRYTSSHRNCPPQYQYTAQSGPPQYQNVAQPGAGNQAWAQMQNTNQVAGNMQPAPYNLNPYPPLYARLDQFSLHWTHAWNQQRDLPDG